MKQMKTRKEIFVCVILLAMLTASSQAQLTIVDHQPDVYGEDRRTNRGRVAVKSNNEPVIALGQFSQDPGIEFKYLIREGLGSWTPRSGPWVTGGASSADLTVDSDDNYHFVYSGTNAPVVYVENTGNRLTVPGDNSWWEGSGAVQLVTNNDGVHVGWYPRNRPPESGSGDNEQTEYIYKTLLDPDPNAPVWSAFTLLDHPNRDMSPRFLGAADVFYYFSLPRDTQAHGGPYYQQADDGDPNVIDLYTGLTSGLKEYGAHYDFFLSPAWNGSAMNLASIELAVGSVGTTTTGIVALYLDLQGASSQVEVYNDGAGGTADGTAESVALAVVNGTNYVFFVAEDPGTEPNDIDSEVFVQAVDQDGNLLGSAQQLTDDNFQQYELDVAVGAGQTSIHLVFNTNLIGGYADDGERVSYMKVTPLVTGPQTCAEALALGHGSPSDLNSDCYVRMDDFALLAQGFGNLSELTAFVADWLGCIDPGNANCDHPWE